MSVHTSKNDALGRRLRDAGATGLLVLALAGVYAWDRPHQETQVASGHQSPHLLESSFGSPEPFAESAPKSSTGLIAESDVDEASAKAKEPAEPTEATDPKRLLDQTVEPKRDFLSRVNKLPTPSLPTKPEPPPIVAQVLMSQTNLNRFGNPEGQGLGLAQANEFKGARILVWSTEPQAHDNVFTADNPLWAALKHLGFVIQMKRTRFEPRWLDEADQLWVLSSKNSGMDAAAYSAVVAFVQDGKELYLLAENAPFFVEATDLTKRLYQTEISGDYPGCNIIAVRGHGVTRDDFRNLDKDAIPEGERESRGEGGKANPKKRDSISRIDIINRATHYAEEHPLLTDVNFIFEGHTVSHIEPTSRLQTVLTASDRQILAAVSLDPGQRVVVDCGWTRFYFSSQARYVTDTAGTIRYAENIAAYLMGKDDKRQGGGQWLDRKKLLEKYRNAPPNDLVAAFHDTNAAERLAAVTMAVRRKLDIPSDLIELIRDADRDVRRQARSALRGLAGFGIDYGPSESANQAEWELSSQHWSGWLRRKQLVAKFAAQSPDLVVAAMMSNDSEERWAAVSAAVPRRLDIPDALIGLLQDAEPEIRELARQALVQLAGKVDFGPGPNANQAATNVAIRDWKRWRVLKKFPDARNADQDYLITAMKSDETERRWAAVIVVQQKKLRLGTNLIDLLDDPDKSVQQAARLALVQIAKGADHGPNEDASDAEVAESSRQWTEWWQHESEKTATQKLQLAETLLKGNPEVARKRLNEIADQFPGTAAAKKAVLLLHRP